MRDSWWKRWVYAVRPWTLPAAIAPVVLGTAMAFGDGAGRWTPAIAAMIVAVLIQTGTNFVNDIADFQRGADTDERTGPVRVIQAGLISKQLLIQTAVIVFALAILVGLWIVMKQQAWLLIPLGASCILAGVLYTAGPVPAAYLGLGDVMVIVFFGPVAVSGTYYLQALSVSWTSVFAGLGCGLICCGILVVNNYRDYDVDKRVDKKTLPVRFGRSFARWEYVGLMSAAVIMSLLVAIVAQRPGVLLSLIAVAASIPAVRLLFSMQSTPQDLNRALSYTGRILVLYALFFGIGWLI